MNNDKHNKTLRDKLSSLDTLSGGIVYGKEEAWEKLQGRLDAKPAKSITLKYALAAAIILLLSFTSLFIYFSHNTQTEQNNTAKISSPIATYTAQLNNQQPIIQPGATPMYTHVKTVERRKKINIAHTVPQTMGAHDTLAQQENVVENKIEVRTPFMTPLTKPMKVVTIRDLENGSTETSDDMNIVSNSEPGVDLSKLPVANMHDIIIEEFEINRIRKENRFSFGQRSDLKPGRADNDQETENELFQKHFSKIKFNFQNQ